MLVLCNTFSIHYNYISLLINTSRIYWHMAPEFLYYNNSFMNHSCVTVQLFCYVKCPKIVITHSLDYLHNPQTLNLTIPSNTMAQEAKDTDLLDCRIRYRGIYRHFLLIVEHHTTCYSQLLIGDMGWMQCKAWLLRLDWQIIHLLGLKSKYKLSYSLLQRKLKGLSFRFKIVSVKVVWAYLF